MEPRIDPTMNKTGARLGKRMFAVSQVIEQSSLPRATQSW
jgi:hypothetical protein